MIRLVRTAARVPRFFTVWPILIVVLLLWFSPAMPFAADSGSQYDLDHNARIDAHDLLLFVSWLRQGAASGDFNHDGRTDSLDLLWFSAAWGQTVDFGPTLPPDPASVAPPVNLSLASDLFAGTSFLYSGKNPIQPGVQSGVMDSQRIVILRGRVLTRDNAPLPGARIAILHHPEFGFTASRADGGFDLAANGGGVVCVTFEKEGYLPVHRTLTLPWREYVILDEVCLTPLDARITEIDLANAVAYQTAEGSPVSDPDGARQARLLVPPGTRAELVLPDGQVQPLQQIHVRATEYTVGENGPRAMPALLPPAVGYTYCVEYSVDEALAAGAAEVRFDRPLIHYNENFLGFPAGSIVPVGYYDRDKAAWIASDNGRVIAILGITGGKADLDITGGGAPATAQELTALGVTEAERERLAALYAPGQSVWRVPVTHFTPWDCNWPYGPPDDAEAPPALDLDPPDDPDVCSLAGSWIGPLNQTTGEDVRITGTPYHLVYQSGRVPGRRDARMLNIPMSGPRVPASLKRIELKIAVAGQELEQSFDPAPDLSYSFAWDGQDGYGRMQQGAQSAEVRLGYVYPAVYKEAGDFPDSFGRFGGAEITASRQRHEITLSQSWRGILGSWNVTGLGLGGWTFSAHHFYDPSTRILYMGNGTQRFADLLDRVITTCAGGGESRAGIGDGGPATQAKLVEPFGIDLGPDGTLYITDTETDLIHKVDPDGVFTTIAGGGNPPDGIGDGGPALEARFYSPMDIAAAPGGSLYVVDHYHYRIRRIRPDGIVETVAGNGTFGFSGDGGPATAAQLQYPHSIALAPDGGFYFSDEENKRIRYVSPDGVITTVAGGGSIGWPTYGNGGPATEAQLVHPTGIALGPDGSLYIADTFNGSIRRVGLDGIITTVAGGGSGGPADLGDGGPATAATLYYPKRVVVGPDNSLYISDQYNERVRYVSPGGIISTLAGTGERGFRGDHGHARQAELYSPEGIKLAPDGRLFIADSNNARVRVIAPPFPGFSDTEISIPDEETNQIFVFNHAGRHLRTIHSLTGAVLHQFTYTRDGLLSAVTDGGGNTTVIERATNGQPSAIMASTGQRTLLTLDAHGYLASITNPAGEATAFAYSSDGLLQSRKDSRDNEWRYSYDPLGRLTREEGPLGRLRALDAVREATQTDISVFTELQRTTRFHAERSALGEISLRTTFPNGTQTARREIAGGTRAITWRDGTRLDQQLGPDPRFGLAAPMTTALNITTPGGLQSAIGIVRSASMMESGNTWIPLGSFTQTVDINGRIFIRTYHGEKRTFTDISPEGRRRDFTIDELGRVIFEQTAGLYPARYLYDLHGRLAQVILGEDPDTRVMSVTYDDAGKVKSITDPLGRVVLYENDAVGRARRVTLPGNRVLEYAYDANGNRTGITPPGRPAHTFQYSVLDQPILYSPPNTDTTGRSTQFSYNTDDQLTGVIRPGGAALQYEYDSGECQCGQLLAVLYSGKRVDYSYDAATGNLIRIQTPEGVTLDYAYDGSLLTTTVWSGPVSGSITRTYDANFRIASRSVNDASPIRFAYDRDNFLIQAGDLALDYDTQNGLLAATAIGRVTDQYEYNRFGEITGYAAYANGSPIYAYSLTRNRLSRVIEKTETVLDRSTAYQYAYSDAGFLIEWKENGLTPRAYTHDGQGNRLTVTEGGTRRSARYNDLDRLLEWGSTIYAYNESGELQSKTESGRVTTYEHNELGYLTGVTLPDGTRIEYLYDGRGRRVGKKVNGTLIQGFLYRNALAPIAELDGQGHVVSTFIYADTPTVPAYLIKNNQTYRILSDHLGSPRLIAATESGDAAQRIDYDESGRVTADTQPGFQPFGFAGGLYDHDTGLIHFGARDYDPETGRWTTPDPSLFDGRETNLYLYAHGDPVNFVDPSGLDAFTFDEGIHKGVGVQLDEETASSDLRCKDRTDENPCIKRFDFRCNGSALGCFAWSGSGSATGGVGLLNDMTLEGDTVKRYELGPEADQEAMKYAQDNASGTYNLFFRNCRQFANEVVNTGKKTEKNAKKDKP
ncbi:MAG: RHS repeat-associated core domain-containing protein [bacterium]